MNEENFDMVALKSDRKTVTSVTVLQVCEFQLSFSYPRVPLTSQHNTSLAERNCIGTSLFHFIKK
jgi:hypothetical protein